MMGIVVLSIVEYINYIPHVDTPEPSGRYGYKESTARINDVAPPKKSPSRLLSGKKLDSQRKTDHRHPTQSQEESLKPDRPADKRLIRGESSDSISSGRQKAELPRDRQSATYTAKEWFEKGRAMDDESEAEIECYNKAIEIDPTFAPAYYCLGAIYFRQANYESAYEEFAEFLKCASEVDRQAYDIYVYCSPFDVERLSEEKLKGEAPAEEVKEEMPPKGETETPAAGEMETPAEGETELGGEASDETGDEVSEKVMTVVRFLPVDGHIMVPVVLNAFLEARVLVDTGAGITVLSRELAQKLELEEEPGHSITLKTMSTDIQARSATLDSIQLGNLIQNNLRVAITDLPREGERKFDGILGMDFMNKYKIQIDNENKKILLSPSKKTS